MITLIQSVETHNQAQTGLEIRFLQGHFGVKIGRGGHIALPIHSYGNNESYRYDGWQLSYLAIYQKHFQRGLWKNTTCSGLVPEPVHHGRVPGTFYR